MSRVLLSVVVAAVVGVSLTGCSSALSSNSSSEQLQALKFESDPLGAEVRTTQGQTCKTPCELKVLSHEQSVTITKNDYAANHPSHPGPAAGPLVLGEPAADSRTQSGPRRAPAGAEASPATQQQDTKIIGLKRDELFTRRLRAVATLRARGAGRWGGVPSS
jgi:hypothetical protein